MTDHISPQFRAILEGAGWDEASIDNATDLAVAKEVRELKKEGIGEAAASSEGGAVLGSDPSESGDAEALALELERLQALPKNAENMAARKKVRLALNEVSPLTVEFR